MRNRRRECEIATKCTKTIAQDWADIAEQTVTPALVTYFEGVKKMLAAAYCYLVSVDAKLTLPITLVGVQHSSFSLRRTLIMKLFI